MSESTASARRQVVGVSPGAALAARPRLFGALEMAFPVTFEPLPAAPSVAAVVSFRGSERALSSVSGATAPTIIFDDAVQRGGPDSTVRLLDADRVDRRLRDVSLLGQRPGDALQPSTLAHDVLATDQSTARWTVSRGPAQVHQVAAALPELAPSEVLRQALMGGHALSIVAIVHFLRELCAGVDFKAPETRAAAVFDDPNVRWRSYGFINFRELVRHADAHGYHAVMAMVPLDATRAHAPTVELFKRRSDRISLTVHGNSHLRDELLAPSDGETALALCAEAIRRIDRFEARTGLAVDRVMTPPHGMCSEAVASALAAVGFDALCSISPVPWSEEVGDDHFLAGWQPATFAGPTAVIPRIPLWCTKTDIALRAFMDNPVVLYGHHEDLATGLDLLEQAASRVNSIGDVRWTSLAQIALSNIGVRTHGDVSVVRPYSSRMRVRLPAETRSLVVEEPRDTRGSLTGWSAGDGPLAPFGVPVPFTAADGAELRLRPRLEVDPNRVPTLGRRPWPLVRRIATEARDRSMPLRPARLR